MPPKVTPILSPSQKSRLQDLLDLQPGEKGVRPCIMHFRDEGDYHVCRRLEDRLVMTIIFPSSPRTCPPG